MELKALKPFRDKVDRDKKYQVNDTLTVDDLDRVNDLVSRGLCVITAIGGEDPGDGGSDKVKLFDKEFELKDVKDALIAVGISVAYNAGMTSINKKLSELTEEQTTAIKGILCKE